MQYDEFINRVQERAELDSRDAAVEIIKATLGTLGERLYRTEREDLAAQLPDEMKPYFSRETSARTSRDRVEPYGLEDFYVRVSARTEDLTVAQAIPKARAVMQVLRSAVSAGSWQSLEDLLPAEYDELLTGEVHGVAHRRSDGTYEVSS
jgi:uncharacterized protein (DUF2267 family)